ncbi:unnamed protein product [Nesidiocoris tenuis]|uniref:Uncharacterized protein n=1 Tax=Nesidiocoris tenuis TaxID=355587 RepID=A0A6H5GMR9_9HEMI|nr:unnamed protein product [Nesidiocoris tenuis]
MTCAIRFSFPTGTDSEYSAVFHRAAPSRDFPLEGLKAGEEMKGEKGAKEKKKGTWYPESQLAFPKKLLRRCIRRRKSKSRRFYPIRKNRAGAVAWMRKRNVHQRILEVFCCGGGSLSDDQSLQADAITRFQADLDGKIRQRISKGMKDNGAFLTEDPIRAKRHEGPGP